MYFLLPLPLFFLVFLFLRAYSCFPSRSLTLQLGLLLHSLSNSTLIVIWQHFNRSEYKHGVFESQRLFLYFLLSLLLDTLLLSLYTPMYSLIFLKSSYAFSSLRTSYTLCNFKFPLERLHSSTTLHELYREIYIYI